MTASTESNTALSTTNKPSGLLWVPAAGLSLLSAVVGTMNFVLCMGHGFYMTAPSTVATAAYSVYGLGKAFGNLARSGKSIVNQFRPGKHIPLTPNQSMANSFNAIAHSYASLIGSKLGAHLVAPDYIDLATPAMATDIVSVIFGTLGYRQLTKSDDSKNTLPPKAPEALKL